jgi:hypothetical protein
VLNPVHYPSQDRMALERYHHLRQGLKEGFHIVMGTDLEQWIRE